MAATILFVSVNKSFRPWMTVTQLEPWAERAWAISVAKASTCDRVIAVVDGWPVAAWRLRGAFPSPDETYLMNDGSTRPRTCLALGDPLPLLREYMEREYPALRRGVATAKWDDIAPLAADHDHAFIAWKDGTN